MLWFKSWRCDPKARELADRHYNRQHIGASNFVPPGSCLVLVTQKYDALWVTSYPKKEYTKHEWAGAFVCSLFRNESNYRASDLILQAVQATIWYYNHIPDMGMITFINPKHVRPTMVRGDKTYGYTWKKAGFKEVGKTKSGLIALKLDKDDMPKPESYLEFQMELLKNAN